MFVLVEVYFSSFYLKWGFFLSLAILFLPHAWRWGFLRCPHVRARARPFCLSFFCSLRFLVVSLSLSLSLCLASSLFASVGLSFSLSLSLSLSPLALCAYLSLPCFFSPLFLCLFLSLRLSLSVYLSLSLSLSFSALSFSLLSIFLPSSLVFSLSLCPHPIFLFFTLSPLYLSLPPFRFLSFSSVTWWHTVCVV